MPGLFIIAHAPLASALKAVAAHVYPEAAGALVVYDVPPGAEADAYDAEAGALLDQLPPGDTLVLTDAFGATPCNIARRLAETRGLRVLVGVNVPMLWRALNYRLKPMDELVNLATAGAHNGVMHYAASKPQNQSQPPSNHDPNNGNDQQ